MKKFPKEIFILFREKFLKDIVKNKLQSTLQCVFGYSLKLTMITSFAS